MLLPIYPGGGVPAPLGMVTMTHGPIGQASVVETTVDATIVVVVVKETAVLVVVRGSVEVTDVVTGSVIVETDVNVVVRSLAILATYPAPALRRIATMRTTDTSSTRIEVT